MESLGAYAFFYHEYATCSSCFGFFQLNQIQESEREVLEADEKRQKEKVMKDFISCFFEIKTFSFQWLNIFTRKFSCNS